MTGVWESLEKVSPRHVLFPYELQDWFVGIPTFPIIFVGAEKPTFQQDVVWDGAGIWQVTEPEISDMAEQALVDVRGLFHESGAGVVVTNKTQRGRPGE